MFSACPPVTAVRSKAPSIQSFTRKIGPATVPCANSPARHGGRLVARRRSELDCRRAGHGMELSRSREQKSHERDGPIRDGRHWRRGQRRHGHRRRVARRRHADRGDWTRCCQAGRTVCAAWALAAAGHRPGIGGRRCVCAPPGHGAGPAAPTAGRGDRQPGQPAQGWAAVGSAGGGPASPPRARRAAASGCRPPSAAAAGRGRRRWSLSAARQPVRVARLVGAWRSLGCGLRHAHARAGVA